MDDLPLVMKLIQQGREKMIASGNPNQWSAAHPSRKRITQDIVQGYSYLLCEDGLPVATFAFLPGPDPTYSYIEGGSWIDDRPYHVIHRVASADGVHGVMADIIGYCSSFASSIRIDTHAANTTMEGVLAGPSDRADGTLNIVGALRRTLATTGYSDVKELQRVGIVLAPYAPS